MLDVLSRLNKVFFLFSGASACRDLLQCIAESQFLTYIAVALPPGLPYAFG